MLAAFAFLLLGALFGGFFRLPAFMVLVLLTLAAYAFWQRHDPAAMLGLEILVALVALQAGYALAIVARLLLNARASRASSDTGLGGEQDPGNTNQG